MKITLCSIANRLRSEEFQPLLSLYEERIAPYARFEMELFRSSDQFFANLEKLKGRTAPFAVLLDSRGKQLSSESFAQWIGSRRAEGLQHLIFAIGPASGWTDAERKRAGLLLSLGVITLPHELARIVLVEQIYRAFTILAGHPYHTGH